MAKTKSALKIMAGDILLDTIRVEGILGKDEVCFLRCTPIGETVPYEKDGIVFSPTDLDEFLFTGAAETALFL